MNLGIAAVAAVLLGSLALGLMVYERTVPGRADGAAAGLGTRDLFLPIVSLTTLLTAFMLVQGYSVYQGAQVAAAEEARKLHDGAAVATYLTDDRGRQEVLGSAVCYARSVAHLEWTAGGGGETAAEVERWVDGIALDFRDDADARGVPSVIVGQMVALDAARGDSRGQRLTEGHTAIPGYLWALLLLSTATVLLGMGAFALPSVPRGSTRIIMISLAALFIAALTVISELDRPFTGLVQIQPTDMLRVAGSLERDYAADFPGAVLACDESGRPNP